jgi:LPS-assembly protein
MALNSNPRSLPAGRIPRPSSSDRVEGGTRTNYGVEYTAQFNRGGSLSAPLGESHQIAGLNFFPVQDLTNTDLESGGLDKRLSDYVGRVAFQPNQIYRFSTRFRFDQETFSLQRLQVEVAANLDRWNASILYGDYAARPLLGFLRQPDGILTSGAYKLNQNRGVNAGVRYNIENAKPSQYCFGLG